MGRGRRREEFTKDCENPNSLSLLSSLSRPPSPFSPARFSQRRIFDWNAASGEMLLSFFAANQERDWVNADRIQRIARHAGVPVFWWYSVINGINDSDIERRLRESDIRSREFFFVGAKVHLLSNINPGRNLANGSSLRLHSLSLLQQRLR